jgi:endo-alpha-1,4-polygalactosaminidase (GH114 family)
MQALQFSDIGNVYFQILKIAPFLSMKKVISSLFLVTFSLLACQDDEVDVVNVVDGSELPSDKTSWWQPATGLTFDWKLDDLTNSDQFSSDVVDVDAFTTSKEQVTALHAQGKKVIAYLSVGTLENDRPDASLLPSEVIGKVYPEWPDEKWLDIRQLDKMKPWLNSRFKMIITKGFDAIEPDNLDSYSNETGFDISIEDTKKYSDFLISLAHQNGLGIGQKNVPELAVGFSPKFDWILTEDAFFQGWEDDVKPYILANKPVFSVEYTDETSQVTFENTFCPKAKLLKYNVILKHRDLDKWVYQCK